MGPPGASFRLWPEEKCPSFPPWVALITMCLNDTSTISKVINRVCFPCLLSSTTSFTALTNVFIQLYSGTFATPFLQFSLYPDSLPIMPHELTTTKLQCNGNTIIVLLPYLLWGNYAPQYSNPSSQLSFPYT